MKTIELHNILYRYYNDNNQAIFYDFEILAKKDKDLAELIFISEDEEYAIEAIEAILNLLPTEWIEEKIEELFEKGDLTDLVENQKISYKDYNSVGIWYFKMTGGPKSTEWNKDLYNEIENNNFIINAISNNKIFISVFDIPMILKYTDGYFHFEGIPILNKDIKDIFVRYLEEKENSEFVIIHKLNNEFTTKLL